jgi:adenylate kinase
VDELSTLYLCTLLRNQVIPSFYILHLSEISVTRLIFIGAPGSGKGTQAQILAQHFQIPHISTGDILRAAVQDQTDLGLQAKSYMDAGDLVPDTLILDLIRDRLAQADASKGWILDGFPRNVAQAEFLDKLLAEIGHQDYVALELSVPDDRLVERLLLRGRADDNEETIRHRLQIYHQKTSPLTAFYQQQQRLRQVDGDRELELVSKDLQAVLASWSWPPE